MFSFTVYHLLVLTLNLFYLPYLPLTRCLSGDAGRSPSSVAREPRVPGQQAPDLLIQDITSSGKWSDYCFVFHQKAIYWGLS